jgi:hypothetical protein
VPLEIITHGGGDHVVLVGELTALYLGADRAFQLLG